jgi:hypothetical protein
MQGVYIGFDNPNIKTIWPVSEVEARATGDHPAPSGQPLFAHFFQPIFPLMTDLSWFTCRWESSPFVDLIFEPGGEERLETYQVDHPRFDNVSASLLRPGCLPALAGWLRDDWIDLLGFALSGDDSGEIADELFDADERGKDEYYATIERRVSLCFFCVDGFSWEFYCKDQEAVTQVFEHVRRMKGVKLELGRLRDRDERFR